MNIIGMLEFQKNIVLKLVDVLPPLRLHSLSLERGLPNMLFHCVFISLVYLIYIKANIMFVVLTGLDG